MEVWTGIDVCVENRFKEFKGLKIGLLVHSASVNSNLRYTWDLFQKTEYRRQKLNVKALFNPEHGLYGTQQYMEGVKSGYDFRTSLPVYSLYETCKEKLAPTEEMLSGIDIMVIDLQDIGTRYYTYIWTMVLVMQACARYKKKVVVLDRPNPLNGVSVEGPVLSPEFSSFVGLYSIPVRHGMTIGELALMFNSHFKIGAELKVIKMQVWKREMWFDDTGLPWVMPSPNMPTLNTAIVYPGMCLLEGTNISEGRGTTKPFEFFGAPWIEPYELCDILNKKDLPGVIFRPVHFIPWSSKYKGELCKGAQVHITDRDKFLSFLTGVYIIKTVKDMYTQFFEWRNPPYEYETKKMPFDLLAGNSTLRKFIESDSVGTIHELSLHWENEIESFASIREQYLLY